MRWYVEEANKQNVIEQDKAHKKSVIQHSIFWSLLRHQIEIDIEGINQTDFWVKRMAGFPLTIETPHTGDGYTIQKAGFPDVAITLRHKGDHVKVERYFVENPLKLQISGTERP